jgi:hypothetical protein
MENVIEDFYDYVLDTTEVQRKLLPFVILYGDGSRWKNKLKDCLQTYQHLRQILINHDIIDLQKNVKG